MSTVKPQIYNIVLQTLIHQQEILEKNFKNQLREETKRRKTIVEELRKAEKKINDLGKIITVSTIYNLSNYWYESSTFQEKDKLINRLHIYSRGRTLPTLKPAEFSSTPSNLNLFDDESVISRLDKKLKHLEIKRNNVVLEKVEPKTSPKQEQPSSNSEPVNTKKDVPKLDDKSIAPKNNKTDETVAGLKFLCYHYICISPKW